jgi:hypothetical protein
MLDLCAPLLYAPRPDRGNLSRHMG